MKNLLLVLFISIIPSSICYAQTQAQIDARNDAIAAYEDAEYAKTNAETAIYTADFNRGNMDTEYDIASVADPRNNTHYAAGLADKITGLENHDPSIDKFGEGNTPMVNGDTDKATGDAFWASASYTQAVNCYILSKGHHDTARTKYEQAFDLSVIAGNAFYDASIHFYNAYTDLW